MTRILMTLWAAIVLPIMATAADFRLVSQEGEEFRLSEKAGACLMFLYNSECDDCSRAGRRLAGSQTVKASELPVVSVAVLETGDGWREKAATQPADWLHSCDVFGEVADSDAIDFSTVPAFVVLDASGEVEFCSVSLNETERFLETKKEGGR